MTATPPPALGRYRPTQFLATGSHFARSWTAKPDDPSAEIWLGVDEETGEEIVLKCYAPRSELAALYANERDVHREMLECPRLARMLAFDDERRVIVKRFISGIVMNAGHVHDARLWAAKSPLVVPPPPNVTRVRQLLTDVMEVVAFAERVGRVADHALGGVGVEAPSCPGEGGAELNTIISERATVVDMCNSPRARWEPSRLVDSAVLCALRMHCSTVPASKRVLILDLYEVPIHQRGPALLAAGIAPSLPALNAARRKALRAADGELLDVIERNSSNANTLHQALVRDLRPTRQQRRQAERQAAKAS